MTLHTQTVCEVDWMFKKQNKILLNSFFFFLLPLPSFLSHRIGSETAFTYTPSLRMLPLLKK